MHARSLVLVSMVCIAALAGCSDDFINLAPTLLFNNLLTAQQVRAGDAVSIQYTDNDPDSPANSSFYADVDGDLATTGDQIVIALGRPTMNGVNQSFNWNTTGAPAAVYNIIAVTMDHAFQVETTAVGKVTVFVFAITKPTVNRTVLVGATINIDYTYIDPDSTPTTDAFADRDGNLGTVGDQFVIDTDRDENGGSQTIAWDTMGVDAGTYFLILVNADTAQGSSRFTAAGRITVVTVTFSPKDGATLLSTAYNARLTFSQSLINTGAVIDANTIPVTAGTQVIPGSYNLENNGTEVNFRPNSGLFPAPSEITVEARTNLLYSDAAAVRGDSATFDTSISLVYVTGRDESTIAVIDASDPNNPTQVDALNIATADRPHFSTCASDGMLYMSHFMGSPNAYVVAYDTTTQTRVGTIPLPAVLGDNTTGASGLALSPDEKILYCAGFEQTGDDPWEWSPFLSVINRASMTEITRIQLNFGGWPRGVAVSPDGTRVYVANPWGGDFGGGPGPGGPGPTLASNSSIVAGVIHVVNALTNTDIDTDGVAGNGVSPIIPAVAFAVGVAVSSDNSTLYASHGGSEVLESLGLTPTPNVSTFNTSTFIEGVPLVSLAQAEAGAPNIFFDIQRNKLYAPRTLVNVNGSVDGLSIFTPFSPVEMIVDVGMVTSSDILRDVDLLWGTDFIVLAATNQQVVVVEVSGAQAVAETDTSNSVRDLATIPPSRH